MSETVLYQSVLQKLGQLNPKSLSQLDAFLSILVGHNTVPKTEKTATNERKSCFGCQPSLVRAFVASPINKSTSVGRK